MNFAKPLRKRFVILIDLPIFFKRVEIVKEKITTGMINSNTFFGELEFVQTIISQFVIIS